MMQRICPHTGWRRTCWTLPDWCAFAVQIEGRRLSRARDAASLRHIALFSFEDVKIEADLTLLRGIIEFIRHRTTSDGFRRPLRGHRADHPTTDVIKAVNNQIARLERGGAGGNR